MTKIESALIGFISCLDDNTPEYFTAEENELVKCASYLVEGIAEYFDKNQTLHIYSGEYDKYDLEADNRTYFNCIGDIIENYKPFGFDCAYCFNKIKGSDNDIKIWNFIVSLTRQNEMF